MALCRHLTAIVLIFSLGAVHSLECHEGFNVSLSGIPFYYWAKHHCARDSECFMQEIATGIPDSKMKDIVLRFGGCISKSLSSFMTCEQLYGEDSEMTLDTAFDILRGLDHKFIKIIGDMVVDSQAHISRFFSRGNDREEFASGVLDFLESIGYDRSKIEAPFANLVRSISSSNIESSLKACGDLVRAAKVDNDATEKLSDALLDFVLKLQDGRVPEIILKATIYGPGLVYPIMRSMFKDEEMRDGYIAIAEGFDNLDMENPASTISEDYQPLFLNLVVAVQMVTSEINPDSCKKVYEKTQKMIRSFQEAHPASPFPEFSLIRSDIVYKCATEVHSLPGCFDHDLDCVTINMQKRTIMRQRRNMDLLKVFHDELATVESAVGLSKMNESNPFGDLGVQDIEELMEPVMKWAEQQSSKSLAIGFNPRMFAELFDLLQPAVAKFVQKLGDNNNELRKAFSPDTCKHLPCAGSLCNSHSAFSSRKDFGESVYKEEL